MSAALAAILGALVLLAVLLVIAIATWTGYRNTVDLLRQKAEIMVSAAVDQLRIHLDVAERQGQFVADSIGRGESDPRDVDSFYALLAGSLAATPQITAIAFVAHDLTVTAAERDQATVIPVFARLAEDPHWQSYVAEAGRAGRAYWTRPVWRDEYGAAQLTRRHPVYRNGQFRGFVNVEVGVPSLSALIGNLESDFGLNAFILADRRYVVAHPVLQFGFPGLTRWRPMPEIRETGDPVLMSIWDRRLHNTRVSRLLATDTGHAIDVGDDSYVFVYRRDDRYGGDWLIGTYLEASDVLKEIERLFQAIVACAAVIAFALLLAVWLGRRISRPVRLLAEQSRRVRNLDFDNTQAVPGSYIKELDEAAAAFNQMVEGLRERQLIRDLFGKYVPREIVSTLLRDKGRLDPQSVDATVLFVDIADFTRLSESLQPQQVVDTLNAYFAAVCEIIEQQGGIVTQFQGDAIVAVFNLPLPVDGHARRAVEAGIRIRARVARDRFVGRCLRCRIGINTGPVVAGNVGARDRLHYTVHGDTVNVAARLDDLNKALGTSLLISASTKDRIGPDWVALRPMGETRIRGKREAVRVYEIPADAVIAAKHGGGGD
ncbi:MAG: adenylate/guanylate cyclase domain-containing protein [Gammaproteobacteria bacterium]|nr:adenylate/guanylate cyclase domain-containing protein [Gammaproteobacteria bacterium]